MGGIDLLRAPSEGNISPWWRIPYSLKDCLPMLRYMIKNDNKLNMIQVKRRKRL